MSLSSTPFHPDPLLPPAELDLPAAGSGRTADRWTRLASWGRADLPRARLAEGHVDALGILREAGASPIPGAVYGVWAARSGGTGAVLDGGRLTGRVRFCSGSQLLDRALVVAASPEGSRIVDVDVTGPGVTPRPGAWRAAAMRASDTEDVEFDVAVSEVIGDPDFYTARPGFWWGGGGVAAVWLGGAQGIVDALHAELRTPDAHQLAHLGALHASLAAADALLERTAALIDADPTEAHRTAVWTLRAAVERTCRETLDLVPRTAGVAVLSAGLADRLADLGMYVRQHHGERDLAALGDAVRADRDAR
ncbi:acyl-CoA dehydrogenase [Pseudonocardia xishanensis]|uniref:Acyl-CoA dehydrogenase n=1 Tax=Pseudonocardia xishanensis TaxID=630995 RepID=A0ABP8S3L5_9PSEU